MNDDILNDIALEKACKRYFNLGVHVEEVIARNITAGLAVRATLFKTVQNTHYLYLGSQTNVTLGDVQRIVRNMQLEADMYLPPRADDEYFKRIGVEHFKRMFPGKHLMSDDDIRYYQTLASYNPALARISRVKGEIRQFTIATQQWRKLKEYAYTKMRVT